MEMLAKVQTCMGVLQEIAGNQIVHVDVLELENFEGDEDE
jgi:hypothetical protein